MTRRRRGRPRSRRTAALAAVLVAACAACTGSRPSATVEPGARSPGAADHGAAVGDEEAPVGGCGPAPGLRPRYLLPYPPGRSFVLTQGNCGSESHGGRFRYAFDFRMPSGTPVLAARDGDVTVVRDDRRDGTGRVGDENIVILEHEDGELSRYIHLRQHSARVERDDRVAAGDTIALSGNSGRSAFPHLHFDVADRCGRGGCHTIPAAFLNSRPRIPDVRAPVEALPRDGTRMGPDPTSAAP